MSKTGRRSSLWPPLIGAVTLAALLLALGQWRGVPFDSAQWKAGKLSHGVGIPIGRDNTRARMVGDLLAHRLRIGVTRQQVERILGEEDCGGDDASMYCLVFMPSLDQKAYARLRWGTSDPYLILEYRSGRLASTKVGR